MPADENGGRVANGFGIPLILGGGLGLYGFAGYGVWHACGAFLGEPGKREMLRAYRRQGNRAQTVDEVHEKMMAQSGNVVPVSALVEAKAVDLQLEGKPQRHLPYLLTGYMTNKYMSWHLTGVRNGSCTFALEGVRHKIGVEASVNDSDLLCTMITGTQQATIHTWGPWKELTHDMGWGHDWRLPAHTQTLQVDVARGDTVLAWGQFRRLDTEDVILNAMDTCDKIGGLEAMRQTPVWLLPNDKNGWLANRFSSFELLDYDLKSLLEKDLEYRERSEGNLVWAAKGMGACFLSLMVGVSILAD